MTPRQKDLVQATWGKIAPIGDAAAALFYDRLFELDPALRPLFKSDIRHQGRQLMGALGAAVRGLDDFGQLVPTLKALGRRHAGYGVRDHHYGTVGAALLWTLEQGLGADFTAEVREAWTAVYAVVAGTMQEAAVPA